MEQGREVMRETWRGIYPITSFVLEALGRQPAAALSARERVLWRVAGFWAAAAGGQLASHLGHDPRMALAEVRRAFGVIGAVHTATLLRAAMESLETGHHAVRTAAVLGRLEESLARCEDNIDELIARYAGNADHQVLQAAVT
jgi:hypothetical protein